MGQQPGGAFFYGGARCGQLGRLREGTIWCAAV